MYLYPMDLVVGLREEESISLVFVIGTRMVIPTSVGGAQYHESRWPYFLDWGSQVLFHQGSGLLFGVAVSFG